MLSSIPGLSRTQAENPQSSNYQATIYLPLLRDTLHIPTSLSNGNCRSMEEFKEIGKFSTVPDYFYKCLDLTKQRLVTLVSYKQSISTDIDLKNHLYEIEIARKLRHHHVLQYYETAVAKLTKMYFVYEPFSCFLIDLMFHKGVYQLSLIKNVMLQLFEALSYMHEHSIIHRFIHPGSIAFTDRGCLKVCDFRYARWLWDKEPGIIAEKPNYQSPEVLMEMPIFNTSMDIWSTACILVELLLQNSFLQGSNALESLQQIFTIFGFPTEECWPDFFKTKGSKFYFSNKIHSYNCLELIFKNSQRVQNQSAMNLLQSMFFYDPVNRPSAKQCSDHIFFAEEPKACVQDGVIYNISIVLRNQNRT